MNKKRSKYKVKVIPVAIAIIVLLVVLGVLVGTIISLVNKGNDISGDSDTIVPQVSQPTSSAVDDSVKDDANDNVGETPTVSDEILPGSSTTDVTVSTTSRELPVGYTWDWNLILINSEDVNGIKSELPFSQTKYDMEIIDSRIKTEYQYMYEAAKKDGVNLYIYSGYRTIQQQQSVYTAKVQEFMERGYIREDALVAAKKVTPEPGHCEHHTGLALDIVSPEYYREFFYLDQNYLSSNVYAWLVQNAPNYGFILRYPADKAEITKVEFEPWHFRYVGVDHALYMTENNLCLEEYIPLIAKAIS